MFGLPDRRKLADSISGLHLRAGACLQPKFEVMLSGRACHYTKFKF